MLLPAHQDLIAEDTHSDPQPHVAGPSALSTQMQHPRPLPAAADHPSHYVYIIIISIVVLLFLAILGRPALQWKRRSGDISSRVRTSV